MNEVLCSKTAFRYWRCPPQIRDLYPCLPENFEGPQRLAASTLICDVLKSPLFVLQLADDARHSSGLKRSVSYAFEPDHGDILETDLGFRVTSPLMTLFTMARVASSLDLVMMMYEFCGWFTLYKPPSHLECSLSKHGNVITTDETDSPDQEEDLLALSDHWVRIVAAYGKNAGKLTKLWRRPPLVSVDELRSFAAKHRRDRYGQKFYAAAAKVFGITASPLEVQAALLLALPRDQGGYGFEHVSLNDWTPLTKPAKLLTWSKEFYGDVVLVNPKLMKTVIIECQGEMVHGSGAILPSDSNRMLALQASGYDVLLVVSEILSDMEQFAVAVKTACNRLDIPFVPKSDEEKGYEANLRSRIFCDWLKLVPEDQNDCKNGYGRKL